MLSSAPLSQATRRALLVWAALGLQSCATRPRPAGDGAATQASDGRAALPPGARPTTPRPPSPLTAESRWLQSWFRGTPVQIVQQGDGPLAIEVPREHCFDPGRPQIRPALAAVLDKLAESLRRLPQARVVQMAAPADAGGGAALAQQRAHQLRLRLLARGIAPTRLLAGTVSAGAAVQLRVELDDAA